MLKLCHVRDSVGLACAMVVVLPDCEMTPEPAVTCPPVGPACAMTLLTDNAAAIRRGPERLPACRAVSATATQALRRLSPHQPIDAIHGRVAIHRISERCAGEGQVDRACSHCRPAAITAHREGCGNAP